MKSIKIIDDCLVCGLGVGHQEVLSHLKSQETAITYNKIWDTSISLIPNSWNEWVAKHSLPHNFTPLQKKLASFIIYWKTQSEILKKMISNPENIQIFWSSTKGGIGDDIYELSKFLFPIGAYFEIPSKHQSIISTACVSGVLAMEEAAQYLHNSKDINYAIVIGVDFISDFIVDGFQSFKALSLDVCKPFHKNRVGLNLGEAMAGMLLTNDPHAKAYANYLGGHSSNDANHLSGPSRTGQELAHAIRHAYTNYDASEIDFILAHGTATLYNDEMETKAFEVSGLGNHPIWAPKYYLGHTLGASGLIETLIAILLLRSGLTLSHPYFEDNSQIIGAKEIFNLEEKISSSYKFIKTAAGFGGCNAAALIEVLIE